MERGHEVEDVFGRGAAAVQLAHLAGAFVIGNASSDEKLAKARELGMHEGINHATQDVAAEVMPQV